MCAGRQEFPEQKPIRVPIKRDGKIIAFLEFPRRVVIIDGRVYAAPPEPPHGR